MSIPIFSSAVRNTLSTLHMVDRQIDAAQQRIATGRKYAGAFDNAAAFFTASALTQRAGALSRRLDEMATAVATLGAASTTLNALTEIVGQAQALITQARGSARTIAIATGNVAFNEATVLTSLNGVNNNNRFTVKVGEAAAVEITITNGTTGTDLLADLNAIDNVEAALTSDGYLRIKATNGEDLTLTNTSGTPLNGLGVATGVHEGAINELRASLAADFDDLRAQFDQLARDGGYNGTNLLAGDSLAVRLNEDGSSQIAIEGLVATVESLGISAASLDFQTDGALDAAAADLASGLAQIKTFAARVEGRLNAIEIRQDFTSGLIQELEAGADKLTLADIEAEGAKLLALQTRRDLAAVSLSLILQQDRSVLQMLSAS